jgi:hypothetical protein
MASGVYDLGEFMTATIATGDDVTVTVAPPTALPQQV